MDDYLRSTDSDTFKRPIIGLLVTVVLIFGVLILRLFYLQIMRGTEYYRLSENNSIRLRDIDPQRGLIYDRQGRLLVDNRPAFDLQIILKDARPLEATLARLSEHIKVPVAQLADVVHKNKNRPAYQPFTLLADIDRDTVAAFEVHRYELPGLEIRVSPKRFYIHHQAAAHVIGYLSQINAQEMKSGRYPHAKSGDYIGKFGVERAMQKMLQGMRGGRQVEVTATGQVVRELSQVAAEPGRNLYLTIDLELQKLAEQLLAERPGSVVAIDPQNGEVLALANFPGFNPNDFIDGMSHKKWQALIRNPDKPLQNKALQAEYPPASTYKIITAMAGLAENVITPQTTFLCTGAYFFGDRDFRCWKRGGHGTVELDRAVAESCDVYFYHVGERLGVDRLAKYATAAGLGSPSGVLLGHESSGLIPTALWKKRRTGVAWQKGETLSISIGQGYNLVTPLQLAILTAAVANGGQVLKPHIVHSYLGDDQKIEKLSKPIVQSRLPVSDEILNLVRKGLQRVVTHPRGTAYKIRLEKIEIAGKTGTAQVVGRKKDQPQKEGQLPIRHRDHAWFVAYAPVAKPQIAISVIVEHGEHGASASAPIAQKLIEAYLKPAVPEREQTIQKVLAGQQPTPQTGLTTPQQRDGT